MLLKRALIFANGSLSNPESLRHILDPDDVIIAADGGTHNALSMGLMPSVIIGDLDSLLEDERQKMESAGAILKISPRNKNETDLEIALNHVIEQGYTPIIIVAALGGRLDQTLGNLFLLTGPQLAGHDIRLDDGVEEAFFTRSSAEVQGVPGDLISLIPWGGEVTGVSTQALKWPLRGERLSPHRTRGISNQMLEETAGIEIESGLLLIVHCRQS